MNPSFSRLTNFALPALLIFACGGAQKAPRPPPPKPIAPSAPRGPTRTDFKTIAKKLVGRCVGGGWIQRWRSEHEDIDVARPRVFLKDFEDKTEQGLDPSYLNTELGNRLRLSRVFEIASAEGPYDFIGQGRLLRLAERTRSGRVSVYTAVLELRNPETDAIVHSCEATVKGEM